MRLVAFVVLLVSIIPGFASTVVCGLAVTDGFKPLSLKGEVGYLATASVEVNSSKLDMDAANSFYEKAEFEAKLILLKSLKPKGYGQQQQPIIGHEVVLRCLRGRRAYVQVFVSKESTELAKDVSGQMENSLLTNPTRKPSGGPPSLLEDQSFELGSKPAAPSMLGL